MKVIFMGTPDFSVGTLQAIIEAGHEVVLCVTQPDKPKGRGKEVQMTPVKEEAVKRGIEVYQPIKIREASCVEVLRSYKADIMVVIAFGQILPKEILEMTKYGCINVHASLLPKYRGAAPIQWSIIDGEDVTGVTTMQMDEGLDTGDMILKTDIIMASDETSGTLYNKLAAAGAQLCVDTLRALEEGTATWERQGETPTAYAKMLDKKMGDIDWTKPAVEIERLVRGLDPWPGAYTTWDGKCMKIWKASVVKENSDSLPGSVAKAQKDTLQIQTGNGLISIMELQIPGKKKMDIDAFLRGNDIKEGLNLLKNSENPIT